MSLVSYSEQEEERIPEGQKEDEKQQQEQQESDMKEAISSITQKVVLKVNKVSPYI